MWSMVAQRLTQITPPAATPDQLWQRVEAAWSAVPQERIQSLFESMPRRVAAGISNNGGYSGYCFWQEPHFTEVYKFNHLILVLHVIYKINFVLYLVFLGVAFTVASSVFTNICYRRYRITELFIYREIKHFREKRRTWDNPAIVNQYFLYSSSGSLELSYGHHLLVLYICTEDSLCRRFEYILKAPLDTFWCIFLPPCMVMTDLLLHRDRESYFWSQYH
ncbi:uncharacterized protein TNCV_3533461 [Trichonephila clavipes]|nr:uncharacterized protein TNCV_3533461 [Trichonephila clavipes]